MGWMQLSVDTCAESTAQVEELLLELGALSITLLDRADQPLLEPAPGELPLWQQVRIQALFHADVDTSALATALQQRADQPLAPHWQALPDQDWERAWMADFQPQRLGQRLWVCPSWCPPPDPDAVNLLLDPGLAFGTGTHPTTALCLEWLDGQPLAGTTVLDYGCGSGILAIAALLLGAESAVAIDHDPQALTATLDNAERNGIPTGQLSVLHPDELAPEARFDLLVANILAAPLIELAPRLQHHLLPGTRFALSGILADQAKAVADAWPASELSLHHRDEWVCLHGRWG